MAKLSSRLISSVPLIVSAALASTSVYANDRDRDSAWYGTIFGEYYWTDDDKDSLEWGLLEDGPGMGGEIGYILNQNWDIRAEYAHDWIDSNGISDNDEVDRFGLDALYHFDSNPLYLVMGAKVFKQENDWEAVNLGLGVRHAMSDHWSIGAEGNVYRGIDDSVTDFGLKVGLTYFFGAPKRHEAKPAPVVAPAAAPVVAEKDSDGDGVVDSKDKCANTPKSDKVDADGCSMFMEQTRTMELNINFANNSDVVDGSHFSEIASFADFMKRFPNTNVEIGGHTSAAGQAAYNQQLSEKRAQAVATILVDEYGIDASRVTAVGYGESQLKYDDSSKNRRIEAVITATEQVKVKK